MPAKSKKQRKLFAMAEHNPAKIYPRNKGVLKMSKSQLHDFAKTKEKGLPTMAKKKKKKHSETMQDYANRRMNQIRKSY